MQSRQVSLQEPGDILDTDTIKLGVNRRGSSTGYCNNPGLGQLLSGPSVYRQSRLAQQECVPHHAGEHLAVAFQFHLLWHPRSFLKEEP